jgi:hypothetical protein
VLRKEAFENLVNGLHVAEELVSRQASRPLNLSIGAGGSFVGRRFQASRSRMDWVPKVHPNDLFPPDRDDCFEKHV